MSHKHRKHSKRERHADHRPQANEPLRILHHHPGYLRARANAFEATEDDAAVGAARTAAEATAGFTSWSHNSKTGSILVEYEPGAVDPDDLLEHIAKAAGLSLGENDITVNSAPKMNREELVSAFMDKVQSINGVVRNAMGGKADLRELAPVALVATSVVSLVLHNKRGLLPRWDSALYHAYRIFMQWHRSEVKEHESPADNSARDESPER